MANHHTYTSLYFLTRETEAFGATDFSQFYEVTLCFVFR